MAPGIAQRMWRLAGEAVLQTVPPSLLSAYAATELAAATGSTMLEASAVVGSVLLLCLMISGSRA